MEDSRHYHLTENSKGQYDAILSSHSTKSSSNIDRNLIFYTINPCNISKSISLVRCYNIYCFAQMRCFTFQSHAPLYWCVQEIGQPVFYQVRCHTVSMLSFYKLLSFPYTFYICFFKIRMISNFVARTVPFSRFSTLCFAVLYPTDNLRTIEYCY